MDASKRETVISIIRALWEKKDASILDLKSGHFYLHLLGMLEQWDKKVGHSSDEDRLMCTKIFLQEYYENERETRIDDFLKFDIILHADNIQIDDSKMELELAKIAIVLLGIGVLDKNSENFMGAVLRVPLEIHFDVLAIIQSVVQAGSSEVALTSRIEDILCEPADSHSVTNTESLITWLHRTQNFSSLASKERGECPDVSPIKPGTFQVELNNSGHNRREKKEEDNCQGVRPNTPIYNLLKTGLIEPSETSTPKDLNKSWTSAAIGSSSALHGSPLRVNLTLLNSSLRDITSPLRGLSIDASSSSSPLTQYAQSPQLIQKAILRQKETEIRRLRRQTEEHIDRADELKYLLQDQTAIVAEKDATITCLERKVQELQRLSLHTELKESAEAENRETIEMLTQRAQSLEQYKSQCMILEKESSMNAEEIRKLNCEIISLEQKNLEYKSILDSQKHLGDDMNDKQMQLNNVVQQLEQMKATKKEWESERQCMQEQINSLKEQNASLRQEVEDFYPLQPGNTSGENMAVVLDIQVGELKSQIDEANQEQERFQSLLQEKQDLLCKTETDLQKLQNELCVAQSKLVEADRLADHQSTLLDQQLKELNDLKEQLENEMNLKSNLHKEKEVLESNFDEKQKQCSYNLEQIASLDKQNKQKDEFIRELESTMQQKASDMIDIQELVTSKDKELEDVKVTVETLNVSIKTLSEELSNKESQIVQLQQDLEVIIKEHQTKQMEFEAEINKMKDQDVKALSELQSSHEAEVSNMNAKHEEVVKELKQAVEQSHLHCNTLQKLSSTQNDDLVELKTNMETVSNSLALKTQELSEKEEYIAKLKKDFEIQFEEMYENKCELKALIEKLQKELDGMIQQFQVIERELVLKTEEVNHKEDQIQNMKFDFDSKIKAGEVKSKEAVESLKAEFEGVRKQEIQEFSQQIETQKVEAERIFTAKNIQMEELERNVKELIDQKMCISVKLEESEKERHEIEAQLQLKLNDISDKEDIIENMKQDHDKQLSSARENNEESLKMLQAEIESMKEMNIQALLQKDISNESQLYEIKHQHEQDIRDIFKKMEEKDAVNATLQKTMADKSLELEKLESELHESHLSLKVKSEEISSDKETISRFEKLALEKDKLIESLRNTLSEEESNHKNTLEEAKAKLKALEDEKMKELLKQKASLEADIANQIVEHEKEVRKLIQSNKDAQESHEQAQKDAEEKANMQLTQEREEHSKLLEAIGQDSDKEREGYLQSLLLKRREVEKLSGELRDVQNELLSQQKQSLDYEKELERVNEELKNAEKKHVHDTDLLSKQVSKNQELYQSLQSKIEQTEKNLTQSNLDLNSANELSKQRTDDLNQAKSHITKIEQDIEKLLDNNRKLSDNNEHLQIQLDENKREGSAESKSLQEIILEKDTLISTLTLERDEKAAIIAGHQQALSDQAAELESLKSSLNSAEKNVAEKEELVHQLQQNVADRDMLTNKMKEDFEEHRLAVHQDNKTLIDELELKYKAAKECELKALADQEVNFKSEIEKIQCEKDKQFQELSTAKSYLETENQTLKSDLDAKTQQQEAGIRELDALACKISETDSQLLMVTQKLEQSDVQLLAHQKDIKEKDIKLQAVQSELKSRIEEIDERDQSINDLKNDFAKKINWLKEENKASQMEIQSKLEESLKSEIAKAAEQQIAIEQYKEQLEELQLKHKSEILELTEEITQLRSKIKELEEHLKYHISQNEESQNLVRQKEAEAEHLHLKIKDLEQLEKSHESQFTKNQDLLKQKEEETARLGAEIESYTSQLRQQRELLSEKGGTISSLQVQVESYELQANQNQEYLTQKNMEILNLLDQIKCLESQSLQSEESHKQKEQEIAEYKLTVEHLRNLEKSHLEQHQACLKQREAEVADLTLTIQHFEAAEKSQNENFQLILGQKEKEASELTGKVEHLQTVCASLQEQQEQNTNCLREKEEEIKHLNVKIDEEQRTKDKQLREMTTEVEETKTELDSFKVHLVKKEKERMSEEKKCRRACEQNAHLEKQVLSLKESHENLAQALKIEKEKNNRSKLSDITLKFENMQKENKQYVSEVNRLKTALDFSERKLREYKKQLDTAGTALLGDNSHFQRTFGKSAGNDSLEGTPDSIGSSRSLRSRSRLSSGNSSFQSGLNETILSGDTVLLKRETIASSADLKKRDKPLRTTEDRLSICSTVSSHSTTSTRGLPGIHLPFAACANEPEDPDYQWDRLGELQRRNTMYLPHLKSAYPVEMQTVEKGKISDDGLRLSTVANQGHVKSEPSASRERRHEHSTHVGSGKANLTKLGIEVNALKRNAPVMSLKEETFEPSPPKQVRTAPNYHRPGPPTPGKAPRRVSGSFSPDQTLSPASVGKNVALGSPITRAQARLTPKTRARRSPRVRASPAASHKQAEKRQSLAFNIGFSPMGKARRSPRLKASPATSQANKQDQRRESVAFNIGFSPMASAGGQMRPPRQGGLMPKKKVAKTSTTSTKIPEPVAQKFRRPLATRNFLETGI